MGGNSNSISKVKQGGDERTTKTVQVARPSSLSDLKNRSENPVGRGQILTILQGNSCSIAQKSGEICTGQADLQPISFKSDRLLGVGEEANAVSLMKWNWNKSYIACGCIVAVVK